MNFIDSIKNNKTQFTFFIILIVYLILVGILFHYNPKDVINKYGGLSIVTALFGTFIIVMLMFFIKRRDEEYGPQFQDQAPPIKTFLITLGYGLLIWLIPLALMFIAYSSFKNVPALATSSIYLLNFFIVIVGITLGYLYIKPYLAANKYAKKSQFAQFLIDVIFFIPCLITDLIDYLKYQYKITTRPVWIIFGIEIVLVVLRITLPKLFSKIIKHDSVKLLEDPIELNTETNLGTYEILNKNKDKFNYNYAISCWIKIDPQPPSTNPSYTTNSNLLSYGGKPAILYNGLTNEIIVTAKTGKEDKQVFKTKDVPYQKWTNFIINYQAGTLDIFMNNNLVSSTPNIVPYMTHDNITVGKNKGIFGYVKDVVYFNNPLTRNKISWIYNS
jgi:hypothetical protein